MSEKISKKQLVGQVLESNMEKTAVVRVDRRFSHPVYRKYVTRSKKYYAHDPQNKCNPGDKVRIMEFRPISRLKRWLVVEIEEKGIQV